MLNFSDLTELPAQSPGAETLTCNFEGTKEATLKWYTGQDAEVTEGGDSPYTVEAGTWSDNATSSVLKIDSSKVSGTPAITCAVAFTDSSVTKDLKTSTILSYISYGRF